MASLNHHLTGASWFWTSAPGRAILLLALAAFLGQPLAAQEALRASLAGEQAALARKHNLENQGYNLKLGDLKLRFQSSLAVEATDNVNYTENNKQADVSLRPELQLYANYPVTDQNTLALNLGAGYAKYAKTKTRDHFFITPNSDIGFDIYAGDFVFNLHTEFTLTQDSYQQTEITGGGYGYFQNRTGVTATWDAGKLIFTLGYDHEIYEPSEKAFEYQSRSSELLNARAVYLLNPTTQIGLQAGASAAEFDLQPAYVTNSIPIYVGTNLLGFLPQRVPAYNFLSNQKSVNFGPYFQSRLSQHMKVTASAGYAIYFQEYDSSFGKAGNSAAFYTDLQFEHKVNSQFGYNLNIGRQVRQGLTTDTLNYTYVRFTPTWRVFNELTVFLPLNFDSTTIDRRNEQYQYYNFGLSASYRVSSKLTLTGSYNYRRRDSNLPGGNYTQNQLVLDTRYSF